MKISKLFHWLYAILMLMPFLAVVFNFIRFSMSGSLTLTSFDDVLDLINVFSFRDNGVTQTIFNVYDYLMADIFGIVYGDLRILISTLLTYWTVISIVYLIFDVLMYVPLLVHRWLDKARLE